MKVGDKVKAVAFTDCFGKFHSEVAGLIVTNIKQDGGISLPVYDRITAEHPDRYAEVRMVEAAERFFELEKQQLDCRAHAGDGEGSLREVQS